MKKIILIGMVALLPLYGMASDVVPSIGDSSQNRFEHVIWDRVPIAIDLPVGSERIISFPQPVTIHNTDTRLTTDKVQILNNNSTLYITAKEEFKPIRLSATLKNGKVVLIDIAGKVNSDARPVDVLIKTGDSTEKSNQQSGSSSTSINYSTLMRFAVQSLYSPERMIDRSKGISRFPMGTTKSVRLLKGTNLISLPLASWSKGGLYVTAVLVKNSSEYDQKISPSLFNGQWRAFAVYPTNLMKPSGHKYDRTTIFLISDQPFFKALDAMRGY